MPKKLLRIGTRGSQLALYQAELTKRLIGGEFPDCRVELVLIKTRGDLFQDKIKIQGTETKRIFTREIEDALTEGKIDLAVHSAKDMAAVLPDGLVFGAVLEREDIRDALISAKYKTLGDMPFGAKVGTSSMRRRAQILKQYPHLKVEDLRGNVDTRLRKAREGLYDGIILAYAGLKRLGLDKHISSILKESEFYPSPGQGAIVVEVREKDSAVKKMVETLNHPRTEKRLVCERAFLRTLEGGCQLPCGIYTRIEKDQLLAFGALFDPENGQAVYGEKKGTIASAEKLGTDVAHGILQNGGQEILEKIRQGAE